MASWLHKSPLLLNIMCCCHLLKKRFLMIVINVNIKELIWNIGKGHENRILWLFYFLYQDFSCIKHKNSKNDHRHGNQTKIFRGHEIHKIYHFTHICMVCTAKKRGRGFNLHVEFFGFLLYMVTNQIKNIQKTKFQESNLLKQYRSLRGRWIWGGS